MTRRDEPIRTHTMADEAPPWWSILFLGTMVFLVLMHFGVVSPVSYTYTNSTEDIYSLERVVSIGGDFRLGTGTISTQPCYYYYSLTSDGGYKINSVDATVTTIYMDESSKPYIKRNYVVVTTYIGSKQRIVAIEIHVPEGTIVQEYAA